MEKTGLVFAGGGARGSYQIGAWKAFRELGMTFDSVIGTSVGALNAALYVMGDLDLAENLWRELELEAVVGWRDEQAEAPEPESVVKTDLFLLSRYVRGGAFSMEPLRRLINSRIDEERIRSSGMDMGLVTFNLSDMKPHIAFLEAIPEGQMTEWLLASACLPAFEPQEVDGKKYIDGAVYDNMPIEPLYLRGHRRIVAVDISGLGRVRSFHADDLELIRIRTSDSLGGMLQFSPELSERNMRLGYCDTLKRFGRMGGTLYNYRCNGNSCRLPIQPETDLDEVQHAIIDRLNHFSRKRVVDRLRACTYERHTLLNAVVEIVADMFELDREPIYELSDFLDRLDAEIRSKATLFTELDRLEEESLTKWLQRVMAVPDKTVKVILQAQAFAASRQLAQIAVSGRTSFAALETLAFANPDIFIASMLLYGLAQGFDLRACGAKPNPA